MYNIIISKCIYYRGKITISMKGSLLLDVQIQQWGTGGPQLVLLKWVWVGRYSAKL